MNLSKTITLVILIFFVNISFAQDVAPENWFNLDYEQDGVRGVSTKKAYEELLKGKKSTTIVVSIIDSGIDEEHEDLKDAMWVNADEIPGNNIDDDNNGYVDDVNGWNFIGGKDGKNINQDALEITRLYAYYKNKKRNKKEEKEFEKIKEEIDAKVSRAKQSLNFYGSLYASLVKLNELMKGESCTMEKINAMEIDEDDEASNTAIKMFSTTLYPNMGMEDTDTIELESMMKRFKGGMDYFESQASYHYNVDFDPRDIVGDDYSNAKQKDYGNNDVTGPDAQHGTHVAGIVGAVRNNDIGMNGVADNVRLMSVRAVPDGDERDKDVANAIYYSVNNGAKIINMSFGKAYKFDKKSVDKAVKYAEKKGVLLVHAAGNSSLNTDIENNYPNKYCNDNRKAKPYKNWIEVGALSWKGGKESPAVFSNYGEKNVDVFAPGVDIYATVPGSEYESLSGTSMASPVTAGVAALVWSYYPELTVYELRKCIVESTVKLNEEVNVPGGGSEMAFSKLCNTSGVVNAYNALKMAESIVSAKK